ncbi:hypothetical protein [Microbacterium invictum]|uniref:Uncharacterized protein n=1 Tax=Microbacterium invictum TaxID=515415 RepID=A0AA40SNS9_9MICO|nr:hypothetical protein [Microbacterium invictum]MBB4139569.1 hypothetical protein [Microbacterium invictum]
MIRPWFRSRLFSVVAGAAIIIGASTTSAAAASVDPAIAYALAHEPGGIVVDEATVVWPHLGMELTVSSVAARGLSSKCPTGLICAFGGHNETGTRLTWATCAVHSTAALPNVLSVAGARSVNSVQARNATTVLATAGAGNYVNVYGTVTNVRCL